jgi:hypothetical protein
LAAGKKARPGRRGVAIERSERAERAERGLAVGARHGERSLREIFAELEFREAQQAKDRDERAKQQGRLDDLAKAMPPMPRLVAEPARPRAKAVKSSAAPVGRDVVAIIRAGRNDDGSLKGGRS